MAIPCSPDWSLVASSSSPSHITCSTKPKSFPPCSKPKSFFSFRPNSNFHVKSSCFPSAPVLAAEEKEEVEEAPPNLRSNHFRLPREYTHHQQPYPASDAENLNAFLRGLLHDPRTEALACDHYKKAKENPRFKPEKSVVKLLVKYLVRTENWDRLLLLLSDDFRRYGTLPDAYTCSTLVENCIRARKFRICERFLAIFQSNPKVSVLAFNSAVKGYNKLHMYSSAIRLHGKMKSSGIGLNSGSYYQAMKAHQKLGNVEKVVALFHEFESEELDPKLEVLTKIYRVLIESLAKSGRASEALGYLRRNKKQDGLLVEDPKIYSSLICSFADSNQAREAEELFHEAIEKNALRDPEAFSKLISMYIERGQVEKTLDVVSTMSHDANLKVTDCVFCTVLNGFAKRRGFSAAIKVYEEMTTKGYEPGQVTYASAINAYYRVANYRRAEKVFAEMREKGFNRCVVAYSTVIAMYGKMGRVGDAMRLLGEMKERKCKPNIWVYNCLLEMHGRAMNVRQVEKIWSEIKRKGVGPDKVSYTSLVSAYNKAKDFDKCVEYFEEYRTVMNGDGVDRKMGGIMVGVFSKMSLIEEMVKLLRDMESVGTGLDARLYATALNALRDAGLESQSKWLKESFQAT
ncbi:unnamed protein product [Linum trigynum]|uniref:Pentatricopeptide repeat-containing protein n=1 Tax=Linum trigynum TaxID=586398 RepID=A0AAV2F2L9_9ROSI